MLKNIKILINTVGKLNSDIQLANFQSNSQPHLVVLDKNKAEISSLMYTNSITELNQFLETGLAEWRKR